MLDDLLSLILWKFPLYNWLSVQTLVGVHSNRRTQTARYQDKVPLTWEAMSFVSSKRLPEAITSFVRFQVNFFRENNQTSTWNFAPWCLFKLRRFPMSRFFLHSHRNRINIFFERLIKLTFVCAGKILELLEGRESLCVCRPKALNASIARGDWFLMKQTHRLYINCINRLYAVTNQSINDRREQNFRPDTSQLGWSEC